MDKPKNLSSLSSTMSSSGDNKYYSLVLIAFITVCAIGMINHEMWRDELTQWLIARDSNSIVYGSVLPELVVDLSEIFD